MCVLVGHRGSCSGFSVFGFADSLSRADVTAGQSRRRWMLIQRAAAAFDDDDDGGGGRVTCSSTWQNERGDGTAQFSFLKTHNAQFHSSCSDKVTAGMKIRVVIRRYWGDYLPVSVWVFAHSAELLTAEGISLVLVTCQDSSFFLLLHNCISLSRPGCKI